MRVGEYCNREVVVIDAASSVTEAARVMREFHVGDVVVVERKYGKQIPTATNSSAMSRSVSIPVGTDPETISVGDAMSFELVTVDLDDDLMHVIEMMRDKGVRRVPVVDADDALVGILSVDDVLDLLSEVLIDIVHLVDSQRRRETRTRP